MALVSYGASDDSDLSEEEEEPQVEKEKASVPVSAGKSTAFQPNGHISDEEDEFLGGGDEDDFIPEKEEPDVFSLIAKKLPQVP